MHAPYILSADDLDDFSGIYRKPSILAADDVLGACYRKAMTLKKLWTLLFLQRGGVVRGGDLNNWGWVQQVAIINFASNPCDNLWGYVGFKELRDKNAHYRCAHPPQFLRFAPLTKTPFWKPPNQSCWSKTSWIFGAFCASRLCMFFEAFLARLGKMVVPARQRPLTTVVSKIITPEKLFFPN